MIAGVAETSDQVPPDKAGAAEDTGLLLLHSLLSPLVVLGLSLDPSLGHRFGPWCKRVIRDHAGGPWRDVDR
jgi:hypothetical protein